MGDIETADAEWDVAEEEMRTQYLQAYQETRSIALQADAVAEGILLNARAFADQFKYSQKLQAESFGHLHNRLGKDEALLLEYMQVRALRDHPNHRSVISVPTV